MPRVLVVVFRCFLEVAYFTAFNVRKPFGRLHADRAFFLVEGYETHLNRASEWGEHMDGAPKADCQETGTLLFAALLHVDDMYETTRSSGRANDASVL